MPVGCMSAVCYSAAILQTQSQGCAAADHLGVLAAYEDQRADDAGEAGPLLCYAVLCYAVLYYMMLYIVYYIL